MLGLLSLIIAAAIFLLHGLGVVENSEDVASWLAIGGFFLTLGLILGAPIINERWGNRLP